MFLEICIQLHSVAFALSGHINKKKVCESNESICAGSKVFVKYQAQEEGFNPNPLRTPLIQYTLQCCCNLKNVDI